VSNPALVGPPAGCGQPLATDLGLVPFAVLLAVAALVASLVSQGGYPHPFGLGVKIVGLHLAAVMFGVGFGSLLALIERAGWRLLVAVAVFLGLFVVRETPLMPLLRLSSHPRHTGHVRGRLRRLALPARPGPGSCGRVLGRPADLTAT
jgi:hypothetical protein